MCKILFLRKFKKISGGQIKVRDYFLHCLRHPRVAPFIYFTPDSDFSRHGLWREVPEERIVRELAPENFETFFVAGRDWELLPADLRGKKIINLLQHVKHGDPRDRRSAYLSRPAYRICVSQEVLDAATPQMNGAAAVIPNGVPLETFTANAAKTAGAIFIWARKNPELGKRLHEALLARGWQSALQTDYVSREDFASALGAADIFVALPNPTEGFYLPALEGMASGCAVVCADAIGNRGFCVHGETCLTPKPGDGDSHLEMIARLLRDRELKEDVRRGGRAMAQAYALENERDRFYRFLDEHILN